MFVPVKSRYFSVWEYYGVDLAILRSCFSEVIVCHSLMSLVKNIHGSDVLFCWWWHRSVLAVLLGRFLRVSTYVTGAIHMFDICEKGVGSDFYKKSWLYRMATKISLRFATANLFISFDQQLQVSSHLTVINPQIIYPAMSQAAEESSRMELVELECGKTKHRKSCEALGEDSVLFYTTIWHTIEQYTRKGLFETLDGLAHLKSRGFRKFTWIIAGGIGDGLTVLRERISQLDLQDFVEIKVDISEDEKNQLYDRADLYLQPSWFEGFGNAVLEANARGLPAVVSRYTAQPEVVGPFGFIAMQISPESICNEIEKFLSLSFEDRVELRSNVLKHALANFSFVKRQEKLCSLLSKARMPL